MPRQAAVLGQPIGHSLSPVLHNAAYAALGLAGWRYTAVDTSEAALPERIAALDETWAGLSLTMPLKQAVIPLLDEIDAVAEVTQAVNTVVVAEGRERLVLKGHNTDALGLSQALLEVFFDEGSSDSETAIILGSGATAVSALVALADVDYPNTLVISRSYPETLLHTASKLGLSPRHLALDIGKPKQAAQAVEAMATAGVVVSTTPAHVADPLADGLLALGAIGERCDGVLLDVVYDPRPTALSAAWAEAGGRVVGGERMLLHQAARQVELMTGLPAPLEAMDTALQNALA
ncbi:MAG: shikimate dehydrogenase [Promicromonosporaceae bacterium]|nr:shikimate dehydrogenase [Promicromonosporaceae bacterium]